MGKLKHNYAISIPNQPSPEMYCRGYGNGPIKMDPLFDEEKKKQRFARLAAQRNKHPKK